MSTKTEGKEVEQKHIKGALKTCGYPNWTFVKTSNRSRRTVRKRKKNGTTSSFLVHVAGISGKLRRIFNNLHILVHFKPSNTLRQRRG